MTDTLTAVKKLTMPIPWLSFAFESEPFSFRLTREAAWYMNGSAHRRWTAAGDAAMMDGSVR